MIIKKKYTGKFKEGSGRKPKYNFNLLTPDDCLIILPDCETQKFAHRVRCALNQYKKHNKLDWGTTVTIEEGKVCVYRIY